MAEHPLKIFEKIDPELLKLVRETNSFALAEGALPRKFKLLIAMALDASHGAARGVRSLAEQAHESGCYPGGDRGGDKGGPIYQRGR